MLSVNTYYTNLKIIWDEIYAAKQTCSCSRCICGGVNNMLKDLNGEYINLFLMGLNDPYIAIRDQILLQDHLPPINNPINKVFSLQSKMRTRDLSTSLLQLVIRLLRPLSHKCRTWLHHLILQLCLCDQPRRILQTLLDDQGHTMLILWKARPRRIQMLQ